VDGKTYVVDARGDGLAVTTADGKEVTEAERGALRGLHGDLGKDDPVVAAISRVPTPLGETFPMGEGLFRALFGASEGQGKFKSGSITLVETRKEGEAPVGVFQWSAEMDSEQGDDLELTWHVKGKTVVAISLAATLSTSMSATIDATGHRIQEGARVEMAGAGTFVDERTNTPL
jgi:hypothetical protein